MSSLILSSKSKQLLCDLSQAGNPTQFLCDLMGNASPKGKRELRGLLQELSHNGFLKITWAGDLPYIVRVSDSADTFFQQLKEKGSGDTMLHGHDHETNGKPVIFISHRGLDKEVADMLVDFLCGTGIPKEYVFCSSLPGNDVDSNIPGEVKDALKHSVVNIAVLSCDYYQSAYCLNEAGILWFLDGVPVIPIGLPEINKNNMYGFLDSHYILRRLDDNTDISHVYDIVRESISAQNCKAAVLTAETKKLVDRYTLFLNARANYQEEHSSVSISDMTTDDERIVLYYILSKKLLKVSKEKIIDWMNKAEVYNVDIDNAFALLSSITGCSLNGNTLEFGVKAFREYTKDNASILQALQPYLESHIQLASNTFMQLMDQSAVDPLLQLFACYIIEERIHSLGDRWMAEAQIQSIKDWEGKNSLDSTLSNNYGKCLEWFKQNSLVYECGWTEYGNAREYAICPSLQTFFNSVPDKYLCVLESAKEAHRFELPF